MDVAQSTLGFDLSLGRMVTSFLMGQTICDRLAIIFRLSIPMNPVGNTGLPYLPPNILNLTDERRQFNRVSEMAGHTGRRATLWARVRKMDRIVQGAIYHCEQDNRVYVFWGIKFGTYYDSKRIWNQKDLSKNDR